MKTVLNPAAEGERQQLQPCAAQHSTMPAPVHAEGSSRSVCPVGPKRPSSAGLGSERLQMPAAGSVCSNRDKFELPVPKASPKRLGITRQSNIGLHSSTQTRAAATCLSKREAVDSDLMESRPAKTRLCHLTELCPMTPSCGRPLFTIPQP